MNKAWDDDLYRLAPAKLNRTHQHTSTPEYGGLGIILTETKFGRAGEEKDKADRDYDLSRGMDEEGSESRASIRLNRLNCERPRVPNFL